MRYVYLVVVLLSFSFAGYAKTLVEPALPHTGNCSLTENATININFNSYETDLSVIQAKFDTKKQEIYKLSKEAGIEKLLLTSMNYNVNPQGNGNNQYQVNGNLSFSVQPPVKASALMVLLSKKGYTPSLNVNAYNQGGRGGGCSVEAGD